MSAVNQPVQRVVSATAAGNVFDAQPAPPLGGRGVVPNLTLMGRMDLPPGFADPPPIDVFWVSNSMHEFAEIVDDRVRITSDCHVTAFMGSNFDIHAHDLDRDPDAGISVRINVNPVGNAQYNFGSGIGNMVDIRGRECFATVPPPNHDHDNNETDEEVDRVSDKYPVGLDTVSGCFTVSTGIAQVPDPASYLEFHHMIQHNLCDDTHRFEWWLTFIVWEY